VSTKKIRVLTGRMGSRAALGTVLTAAFYLPTALAEDAIPQSVTPGTQLEEVLVTAQRRESKLQDTPIAVSVIDGGEIQRENLVNLSEIAAKAAEYHIQSGKPFRIVHFHSRDDHRQ
jgi:iron complex outermembrane receptor protein